MKQKMMMKTPQTIPISRRAGALALLGAAALLTAPVWMPAAHAQGPQGGFGGPGQGGFGGPGQGGPGGFGGGQGGFNRRPPFAYGTVTAVDAGAGTITLSGRGGGGDQTIQTQGTTSIVTQTTAAVSDLKKGDTIEVQGIPTGITASSVTIGQSPLSGLGGPGGGPGGPPPGGGGGFGGPGAMPAPATASARGTVTSTSPLTISLSSTASLTLKMEPNAKVTKFTTVALSAIKVGDKVMGIGTANDDGSFAATTVAVNVDMGAMGQGGRGGFGRRSSARTPFGGPNGGGPNGFGGPNNGGGPGGMPASGFGGPDGGPGGPPPGGFGGPPAQ